MRRPPIARRHQGRTIFRTTCDALSPLRKSPAVLERPASPTKPVPDALHPRHHCPRPEEHDPQDGEDPSQCHPHFVRRTSLRKLRRERSRQAQGQGQATEYKDALYTSYRQT